MPLTNQECAALIEDAIDVARCLREGATYADHAIQSLVIDTIGPFTQVNFPRVEEPNGSLRANVDFSVWSAVVRALGFDDMKWDALVGEDDVSTYYFAPYGERHPRYPHYLMEVEGTLGAIARIFAGQTRVVDTPGAQIHVEAVGRRALWRVQVTVRATDVIDAIIAVLTACGLDVFERDDSNGFYVFAQ